jgi:peptidoglycan/xylan/chitin deacetylase (PgdA/CDA1 family)
MTFKAPQPQSYSGHERDRERYVTISVDDGDVLDLRTADLLNKHGLKATFYVPGTNEERPVMDPEQMREIDAQFEIGSHTLNHARLIGLPPLESWREISDGKKALEEILGHQVVSFCYPGGKFNRRIAIQVAQAGFLAARTCMYFLNDFPQTPYVWGISTYANTYPTYVQFRHCLLEQNFAGAYNYVAKFRAHTAWASQFLCALEDVSRNGGIAHLYFHSWEIDENGEWDELENLLKAIAEYPLTPVTNGYLFRQWRERRGLVSSAPQGLSALHL